MKIIKTKTVFKGNYLDVKETSFVSQDGEKGTWEYVDRHYLFPFVVIFALTKDKEVILEKSYRAPVQDWVLELPAGINDVPGETGQQAAARELFEETGYRSEKMISIVQYTINPSTSTETGSFYFAPDAVFVGGNVGDGIEEIEVVKVPLAELVDFVEKQSKKMRVSDRILAAFPILKQKGLI